MKKIISGFVFAAIAGLSVSATATASAEGKYHKFMKDLEQKEISLAKEKFQAMTASLEKLIGSKMTFEKDCATSDSPKCKTLFNEILEAELQVLKSTRKNVQASIQGLKKARQDAKKL